MASLHKALPFTLIALSLITMSCTDHSQKNAQGYIEGRYTYIATSVSGVLKKLAVVRGTRIKQGQLLFMLEEQPESDIYEAALENLKQTESARDAITANLAYAKITFERYKVLVPKNAIQQSELDRAKSTYDSTIAQLAQANSTIAEQTATLAQAKWTKDQKNIYAPIDGIVFDTYYRLGEYTEANEAILSMLAPADIKAIFFIGERDLSSLKLGDKISVHCAGCKPTTGRISFISPSAEFTPPVIYSTETNEKLIFRIEAEFAPTDAINLHPGQPITVTYRLHD